MITKKEVQHIARLARLGLTEKEIEKMKKDLSSILDYFKKLKEVNISGIEPTSHSIKIENIMREDEPLSIEPGRQRKIIEQAPETKKGYLKVKSIL